MSYEPLFVAMWVLLVGAFAFAGWVCYKDKDNWP